MDRNEQSAAADFAQTATSKVEIVVNKLMEDSTKTDRAFLTTLRNLLADVRARLSEPCDFASFAVDNKFGRRLLRVLRALEGLVNWPDRPGSKPTSKEHFSCDNYRALLKLLGPASAQQQTKSKLNIKSLANGKDERSKKARKNFRLTLEEFSKPEKLSLSRGPPLADLLVSSANPTGQDEYTGYLCVLHDALCSKLAIGGINGDYTANIGLTHSKGSGSANDEILIDSFFLPRPLNSGSEASRWKQAQLRVFLQNDRRNDMHLRWKCDPIYPEDFYRLICRNAGPEKLVLRVSRDGLAWVPAEKPDPKRPFLLEAPSVSLATVIDRQKLNNQDQLKLLLSYLLAKAVWQSYASAWMTPHWTKHVIHFMLQTLDYLSDSDGSVMVHKPYLTTELRPPCSHHPFQVQQPSEDFSLTNKFPPPASHPHPKVLSLGIMLLEIQLGEGIEKRRQQVHQISEDHFAAVSIIMSPSWEERVRYQALREIIEVCIRGETGKIGVNETDVRAGLFTYVVEPLRRLFKKAWPDHEEPESCDPDPVHFGPAEASPENLESLKHKVPVNKTASWAQTLTLRQPHNSTSNLTPQVNGIAGQRQARPSIHLGFGKCFTNEMYVPTYLAHFVQAPMTPLESHPEKDLPSLFTGGIFPIRGLLLSDSGLLCSTRGASQKKYLKSFGNRTVQLMLLMLTCHRRSESSGSKIIGELQRTIKGRLQRWETDERIRIAILDTGMDNKVYEENRKNKLEKRPWNRVVARSNFCVPEEEEPDTNTHDLDGHGTKVASIVLNLAENIDLYIARVCRGEYIEDAGRDKVEEFKNPEPAVVARAIHWAVENKVDVINLSLGYRDEQGDPGISGLRTALEEAIKERILVFAATSNEGLTADIAWPAKNLTYAIGVHSNTNHGLPSSFIGRASHEANLMIVGEDILARGRQGDLQLCSGTSFATPVAAAVGSMILAFVGQKACEQEVEDLISANWNFKGDLRTNRGMRRVLEKISEAVPSSGGTYYRISSKLLWENCHLEDGRKHALNIIVGALKG